MLSLLVFIIILGILVLIHELGHFLMAKKMGVLVEEFGFGLPPRIWGKKIGETIYSINLLFFGGFVKLYGEEQHELKTRKLSNRTFVSKKPWKKVLIILSGVFMNALLAVIIYYGLLLGNGFQSEPLPLFNNYQFRFGRQEGRVVVAQVVKGSPSDKAGVKSEDIVLRFKTDSTNWIDIKSGEQLIANVGKLEKVPVTINFYNLKNGLRKTLTIKPVYDKTLKRSVIGIQMIDSIVIKYNNTLTEKVLSGFLHSYNMTVYNLKTFAYLFKSAYKEKNVQIVSQSVSGPIGIFAVIQDLVKTSGNKFIVNLLNIIAALSLSLALMNIFPFPALDGGRLIFIVYEWIAGRQANQKIEYYVNLAGFCLLIGLALIISFNDIMRFIK